jgi:hypothetical protein
VYFSCVAVLRVRGTWRRCTYGTPGICSRVPTQLHRVIYFYCVFLTSVLLLLQAVQGSGRRAPNPPAEESGQGRARQASTGPAPEVSAVGGSWDCRALRCQHCSARCYLRFVMQHSHSVSFCPVIALLVLIVCFFCVYIGCD